MTVVFSVLDRAFVLAAMIACVSLFSCRTNSRASVAEDGRAQAAHQALDAELTGYPYPFAVSFRRFDAQRQQVRMAYMDVAPKEANGRTVLLLHGKNFCSAYWADTIRVLTAHGYRVVAPDQIGFGKSTKPEHYQFSFEALARDTRDLLSELKIERVTVVGHSMGGMLATRFSLMFPDFVEGLVLVNPIGLEDYRAVAKYAPLDDVYADELKATPDSIRAYQRENYFGGRWKPEYEILVAPLIGWNLGPDRARVAWCAAATQDMISTQPVVGDFQRLRARTLLVIGLRDKTALGKKTAPPADAAKLGDYTQLGKQAQAAIAGAELVEIEGVGHLPQVEDFAAYSKALLAFLEKLTRV